VLKGGVVGALAKFGAASDQLLLIGRHRTTLPVSWVTAVRPHRMSPLVFNMPANTRRLLRYAVEFIQHARKLGVSRVAFYGHTRSDAEILPSSLAAVGSDVEALSSGIARERTRTHQGCFHA
jgi:hypothetical protein